jgi:hypothetical protein
VFVDADVLASRTPYEWLALLRDETDAFQLHSSPAVVADAVRLWRSRDPAAREAAAPRHLVLLTASLDEVVGDGVVGDGDTGAEPDHPGRVGGSAVEDAVASGAQVLLSSSVRTSGTDDHLPFEVFTPDQFLCLTDDTAPAAVRDVTRQRAAEPLAAALAAAGCPAFAARVAAHLRAIAR